DRGPLGDREDVHRVVGRVLVVRELVRGVHRLRLPGAVDDGHSLGGATVMWFRGRGAHVVTATTGALALADLGVGVTGHRDLAHGALVGRPGQGVVGEGEGLRAERHQLYDHGAAGGDVGGPGAADRLGEERGLLIDLVPVRAGRVEVGVEVQTGVDEVEASP